jgi:hypothetical protein
MVAPKKDDRRKPDKRRIETVPTRDLVRSIREDLERERQKRERESQKK